MKAMTALSPGIASLGDEIDSLATGLRRSVVTVRDGGRGAGSGVIWHADGVIVTNHHVAPGKRAQILLDDGRWLDARVRLSDPRRDLAILDVPARGLPAARAGDADEVRVGELVFAIGNPLGLTGAVTAGIISGIGGRYAHGRRRGEGLIQADVSLAPGNSGGPLATADGRVIGINAMVHMPGLALAVPSNAVEALLSGGEQGRVYLGVTLLPAALPAARSEAGAPKIGFLITSVAPDSPADEAGLLLGDILVSLGGERLLSDELLGMALDGLVPGDELTIEVLRGGRPLSLVLVTGRRLEEAA